MSALLARSLRWIPAMPDANRAQSLVSGATVRFRISDVMFPPADELLQQLFGNELLEGCVVAASEGAARRTAHVAVAVPGLKDPVLVPHAKLIPWRSL
jgi:hypothetical protein